MVFRVKISLEEITSKQLKDIYGFYREAYGIKKSKI